METYHLDYSMMQTSNHVACSSSCTIDQSCQTPAPIAYFDLQTKDMQASTSNVALTMI